MEGLEEVSPTSHSETDPFACVFRFQLPEIDNENMAPTICCQKTYQVLTRHTPLDLALLCSVPSPSLHQNSRAGETRKQQAKKVDEIRAGTAGVREGCARGVANHDNIWSGHGSINYINGFA